MAKVREERGMRRSVPMGGSAAAHCPWAGNGSEHPRRAGIPAGILGWAAAGLGGAGLPGVRTHPEPRRVRGRRSPLLPGHGKRAAGAAREAWPDAMETEVGVGVSIYGSVPSEFWVWNGRKIVFCLWEA